MDRGAQLLNEMDNLFADIAGLEAKRRRLRFLQTTVRLAQMILSGGHTFADAIEILEYANSNPSRVCSKPESK
jgi:hypothetical protein